MKQLGRRFHREHLQKGVWLGTAESDVRARRTGITALSDTSDPKLSDGCNENFSFNPMPKKNPKCLVLHNLAASDKAPPPPATDENSPRPLIPGNQRVCVLP